MAKAMSLYDWILDKYPNHEKSPTVMFIKGFILEQEFKQEDQARKLYEDFLKKYPNHEMASSAKFLLDNMGKSDEEILKGIEAKKAKEAN
jgi:TolA-binding protein